MSKTMTTRVEHLGAGVLTLPEKEARPLGNYWKALVPIVRGSGAATAADTRRFETECLVLLRAIRGGHYRVDS